MDLSFSVRFLIILALAASIVTVQTTEVSTVAEMKMRRLGGKTLPSPPPPPVPNTRMSHIPPVRPPPMALHV
ncbi:hypothetical protein MANES_10G060600v8 [Manihot esculenta]|uniref:Uncharacterized protein n=1 Tax=Manihot esculenta TaxID=3983 RepID=A0A2C9V3Q2_MANES|nr:hypothetical protein MANES_10G060600v8 [Manihot esculenta]